jgi:hypothetical protein
MTSLVFLLLLGSVICNRGFYALSMTVGVSFIGIVPITQVTFDWVGFFIA